MHQRSATVTAGSISPVARSNTQSCAPSRCLTEHKVKGRPDEACRPRWWKWKKYGCNSAAVQPAEVLTLCTSLCDSGAAIFLTTKRLLCTFNLVLPGGPCAWRARSNSESFETSPGSVPVPWAKTPKASRDCRKSSENFDAIRRVRNITEMQAAVVILTRTTMPSNDTFSDSTCCWWLWWLRLLLLYDCHKTWLSWLSLAASEMLWQWCLHDMRKGGSFWYSFVLDDIFLFFQASLSEENQANYINQASQALLQHRQFQSEAGHTRLHLEALKRLAGRPNQLLQENTVMLQRQLRSPKQKHNIITQPPARPRIQIEKQRFRF